MILYAAGHPGSGYFAACVRNRVAKLFSALNEEKFVRRFPRDLKLMVDSGAHSWMNGQKQNLPQLHLWIDNYLEMARNSQHKDAVWVELDLYKNSSDLFLQESELDGIAKAGKQCVGQDRFIRVYHARADGGTCNLVKKWIDTGDSYIGLSGDHLPLRDQIAIASRVFALTGKTVRVHGFAMLKRELYLQFPFFSIDAASPKAVVMYGREWQSNLLTKQKGDVRVPRGGVAEACYLDKALASLKALEEDLTKYWEKRGFVWQENSGQN